MTLWFILFSFLNGALLAFQQAMNAALGVRLGSMGGSAVNTLVGALFAGLLLLIGFRTGPMQFAGVPWIYFLGGGLGLCSVAMSNYSIPRIGVTLTAILFMTSDLLAASLIDHFGLFGAQTLPLTFSHGLGILLLTAGAVLVFGKKKSTTVSHIWETKASCKDTASVS